MKDMLIIDDPQTDEFIENFKTPPILPIEFKKIHRRQANAYFLVNTSPWTDSFICAGTPLHELTHLSAPSGGTPEVRKSRRQQDKLTPANS